LTSISAGYALRPAKGKDISKVKILVLSLALITANSVYAYDDGDFQAWHTEVQEIKMSKEFKLAFEEEFRWGDNANDFYYHHYDAAFIYGVNKYLDVGLGYRQIYEKKKGEFKEENQPNINAAVKWEFLGYKLEDRSRLEYRHYDYQTDFWQYRNKFTMKLPWKFTKIEIQPYLADEIFLSFDGTAFTRNRFFSGLGFNLTKNLKAEIYYLLQASKSAHKWTDANVLGTKIKLLF